MLQSTLILKEGPWGARSGRYSTHMWTVQCAYSTRSIRDPTDRLVAMHKEPTDRRHLVMSFSICISNSTRSHYNDNAGPRSINDWMAWVTLYSAKPMVGLVLGHWCCLFMTTIRMWSSKNKCACVRVFLKYSETWIFYPCPCWGLACQREKPV